MRRFVPYLVFVFGIPAIVGAVLVRDRYPVGQSVPAEVYTAPFDPCDPAYRFMQAPPKDWAERFGNSERTMLIHAVSELRVVVAQQGQRLLALEAIHKVELTPKDPNVGSTGSPQEAKP
jgi:hypothetical protein